MSRNVSQKELEHPEAAEKAETFAVLVRCLGYGQGTHTFANGDKYVGEFGS